jgi:ketosteroid isomerase-like protein
MQQADADTEAVKAAVYAIYAALSARDMRKMETLWVHDDQVVVINVPDKVPSIGWEASKKNWESVIDFYAEVNAKPKHAPHVRFIHGAASTTTIIAVHGKTKKAGQPETLSLLATQIFVKHGERWLAIAHHASRIPD